MPNLFGTRILGKTWRARGKDFELALKGAIPHLEQNCPDMAEDFRCEFNYMTGMGMFTKCMTFDEEKHVLEALKLAYIDRKSEMQKLPDDSEEKQYMLNFLLHFQELITMLEEEVNDIERGKLILQDDGTAMLNEDFKED